MDATLGLRDEPSRFQRARRSRIPGLTHAGAAVRGLRCKQQRLPRTADRTRAALGSERVPSNRALISLETVRFALTSARMTTSIMMNSTLIAYPCCVNGRRHVAEG